MRETKANPPQLLLEQYLCVPDKTTGFAFDATKNEWDYARFKADTKYIIAPGKSGKPAFMVTPVGENIPEGNCQDGFTDTGVLFCRTLDGDINFNRVNGRYVKTFMFGYYIVGYSPSRRQMPPAGRCRFRLASVRRSECQMAETMMKWITSLLWLASLIGAPSLANAEQFTLMCRFTGLGGDTRGVPIDRNFMVDLDQRTGRWIPSKN